MRVERRTEVVVPSKPSSVTSIDVHGNVGQVEGLEGICHTVLVTLSRVLAGLQVDVGDQVGEGIGLNDEGDGSVGVLLEDSDNC